MQLNQVLGFHSGINNLHFILFYDITILLFEDSTKIFRRKFREKITQWRGVVTTVLVVMLTRWDEVLAGMAGKE